MLDEVRKGGYMLVLASCLVPAASSRVPVGRISKVAQNAQGKSPAQTFTLLKFENGRALGGSVATSGIGLADAQGVVIAPSQVGRDRSLFLPVETAEALLVRAGTFANDVWSSDDGVEWTCVCESAPW